MRTSFEPANYVAGEFRNSDETFAVINPANAQRLAVAPIASEADVDDAVEAARAAQRDWAAMPPIERAGYLVRLADKVRSNARELADILVQEQSKVRPLAEVEVNFTAEYLDYMAGWARRIEGEVLTSDRRDEHIFLFRKALGVVGGILPWNFPFFLIARKMAPALVMGNTCVIKPSEETPLNCFAMTQLIDQLDLPRGVFNMVMGYGSTGAALARHPDVDMVSFTGSVGTGAAIMAAAAPHITRVNLELGGKAPAIVLEDADVDLAVKAIHASRVINTGQVCNCAERVYVHRAVAQEFTEKMADAMGNTKFGDPSRAEGLDMGSLISADQLKAIESKVSQSIAEGAVVVTGGTVADIGAGHHFLPTVLADCDGTMPVMTTEVFGPVLPIQTVDGLDEALLLANATDYGLTSSIYTRDLSSALRAGRELEFGETYVNRENFEAMQGFHAGAKKSGIGGADGKHGLYEYSRTHVMYVQG